MICVDNNDDSSIAINGTVDFTTAGLGLNKSDRQDMNQCVYGKDFVQSSLMQFNFLWDNEDYLEDVKEEVLNQMQTMHKENPAEFIYFLSLYNIFSDSFIRYPPFQLFFWIHHNKRGCFLPPHFCCNPAT